VNRKKSLTYELDAPVGDEKKLVLELERPVVLRMLEITLLERTPGIKWPGHAGISEIEWLDRR